MKIIELNHTLGGGGAERMTVDLCNRFAEQGNEVIAFITDSTRNPRNTMYKGDLTSKVVFASAEAKTGLSFRAIWATFCEVIKQKPDVVHSHCNVLLLLLPAIFCPKVRYIHTIHTLVPRQFSGGIKKWIANWLFKTKRIIPITISDECHYSYKECFGRQEDILITNGREPLSISENYNEVRKELAAMGIESDSDEPVFIHVARHHKVKNHERLFSTFERLEAENVRFQLLVLGDRYEGYIERLKNIKQIHLLGSRKNVGDYMSFADFFVLSSDKEGLPLTLLEAMSMGVIPVCTPAGGIKDVIRNGENGFMNNELTDESFYQSVKEALSKRSSISKDRIINEFNELYSMAVCSKKYSKLYDSISIR